MTQHNLNKRALFEQDSNQYCKLNLELRATSLRVTAGSLLHFKPLQSLLLLHPSLFPRPPYQHTAIHPTGQSLVTISQPQLWQQF